MSNDVDFASGAPLLDEAIAAGEKLIADNPHFSLDDGVFGHVPAHVGKSGAAIETARRGSSFRYVFRANGAFEFNGYAESTMHGCTTSLFQDKRGSYSISGNRLTLSLTKNFWRKQNACAPSSNSERDYKLDAETYDFTTKIDEYGKTLVCLSNAGGETCYRREG